LQSAHLQTVFGATPDSYSSKRPQMIRLKMFIDIVKLKSIDSKWLFLEG
jgi:hypothetical protein